MNKERKERFKDVISLLDDAHSELEDIQMEEEEAFDNLSDDMQMSERGEKMQEWIDFLDDTMDEIDTLMSKMESKLK